LDIERKIELICRPPTEEIVTPNDLRTLLENEEHPIAYNGWEPSGLAHLGTGVICAYKMKDFAEAGLHFKAFLATWHAWLNNKLGGDPELIHKAADLFRYSWLALGVPEDKVEFIYSDELYKDIQYWAKTINIAKNLTLARTTRTLEIAGRKQDDAHYISDYLYTPMQVADIFHMNVKICQLGMDQRKANMVAREIGEKIGQYKPTCIHHHLLQGLEKPTLWPIPDGQEREALASAKMSKSKPKTCIFIYDTPQEIHQKMTHAFCPERTIKFNPVLDIAKYIIFREKNLFNIERPTKFGGNIQFDNYTQLENSYATGQLHPADLKHGLAIELANILEPVRRYFANHKQAQTCLETIQQAKITR